MEYRIRFLFEQVIEGCSVTDIETADYTFGTKQITSVTTSHGKIKTKNVITSILIFFLK